MSTLKAELLAKSYKGREVVKNVGLEVKAGSIVGLLGPNGAGKTTTFYMIVGLVPSDKGKISIDDFRLISQLHDLGVIESPQFVPPHFKDLRGLATWLSFGRFIGDLSFEKLENDYKPLFL